MNARARLLETELGCLRLEQGCATPELGCTRVGRVCEHVVPLTNLSTRE